MSFREHSIARADRPVLGHLLTWHVRDESPDAPWVTRGPDVQQHFPTMARARQFLLDRRDDRNFVLMFWVVVREGINRGVYHDAYANYSMSHLRPQDPGTDLACVKCGSEDLTSRCEPCNFDP